MNHPIMFLDRVIKIKLVPAIFFLLFKNYYERKIIFSLKSVIVIIAIMSLHFKETN